MCGGRRENLPRSGHTTAGRTARTEGEPLRQPSADPPGEPPDTPPSWVRWTTGTGLVVIPVVLLTPYAFWSRLIVLAALVATVSMLCRTDET
jgi:hypothetical protein